MKTLTVLSRKGGSGKTTVSVSLALAGQQAGLRVVLADLDPLHSAAEVLRTRPEASSFLFETKAPSCSCCRTPVAGTAATCSSSTRRRRPKRTC